jgi:ferredoxin
MSIEIRFEVENKPEQTGVVAEGTYLWDAAKRMGIYLEAECGGEGKCDTCAVTVNSGALLLSTPTSAEMHHLTDERRNAGERLACQARCQTSGEIVVMVKETVKEETEKDKERDFRKEFAELPMEKKFATLVQLEAHALGETVNFITGLPSLVTRKVMDLMGGFGKKMDEQKRASRRPAEHQTNETKTNETASES